MIYLVNIEEQDIARNHLIIGEERVMKSAKQSMMRTCPEKLNSFCAKIGMIRGYVHDTVNDRIEFSELQIIYYY